MADERIEQREPPASLIALRNELPLHPVIYREAIQGRNFEECLAIVAYMLDIALDGMYDVEDLCDLLVTELKRQGAISVDGTTVSKRDHRLVPATILELKDRIVIEKGTVEVQEVGGVERLGIVDEDAGTSVLLAEEGTVRVDSEGNVHETGNNVIEGESKPLSELDSEPVIAVVDEVDDSSHKNDRVEKEADDQTFH